MNMPFLELMKNENENSRLSFLLTYEIKSGMQVEMIKYQNVYQLVLLN